jgi:hypothetical protein
MSEDLDAEGFGDAAQGDAGMAISPRRRSRARAGARTECREHQDGRDRQRERGDHGVPIHDIPADELLHPERDGLLAIRRQNQGKPEAFQIGTMVKTATVAMAGAPEAGSRPEDPVFVDAVAARGVPQIAGLVHEFGQEMMASGRPWAV